MAAVMGVAREVVVAESALRILAPMAAAAVGVKKVALLALIEKYRALMAGAGVAA